MQDTFILAYYRAVHKFLVNKAFMNIDFILHYLFSKEYNNIGQNFYKTICIMFA